MSLLLLLALENRGILGCQFHDQDPINVTYAELKGLRAFIVKNLRLGYRFPCAFYYSSSLPLWPQQYVD